MTTYNIYLNDGKSEHSEYLTNLELSSINDFEFDTDEQNGIYVTQEQVSKVLKALKIDVSALEHDYTENFEDCYIFLKEEE